MVLQEFPERFVLSAMNLTNVKSCLKKFFHMIYIWSVPFLWHKIHARIAPQMKHILKFVFVKFVNKLQAVMPQIKQINLTGGMDAHQDLVGNN